jgi:outer membrane protein assembly factor BamD (BamD/ComL family)
MRLGSFFCVLLLTLLIGCSSVPDDITEDITVEELIQKGQGASDNNAYDKALIYYETILDRFPLDIDNICAAEYEIAFIHYKQGKYVQSREEFNALLSRYDTPDGELLPPKYKRLATIVLGSIDEKEAQGKRLSFFKN